MLIARTVADASQVAEFTTSEEDKQARATDPCINNRKEEQRAPAKDCTAGIALVVFCCGHVAAFAELWGAETYIQILSLVVSVFSGGQPIPVVVGETWDPTNLIPPRLGAYCHDDW